MIGHFTEDAETFASWGVDFVKADFCHVPSNESSNTQNLYDNFSQALNASGRPILFSLCEWGEKEVRCLFYYCSIMVEPLTFFQIAHS